MKIYHVTASGKLWSPELLKKGVGCYTTQREEWHLLHWRAKLARKRLETSVRFELEGCRLEHLVNNPGQDLRTDVSSSCMHERLSW